MTRFLSESLQADEPFFRHGIRRLEDANGRPSADIRLTTEVQQATKNKMRELGLDPHDTTAEELYHALTERIKADDARLTRTLRILSATHVSAEAEVTAGLAHALRELPDSKRCFAMKTSVLKSMLRKAPPKKALKQLGYRSLDSLLKHEAPILTLAAAWFAESVQWRRKFLEQYKKLQPSDFEDRSIVILHPTSRRWRTFAAELVDTNRHNIVAFKELGAIIVLPLAEQAPAGSVTASATTALHALNEVRAASTYLKLCVVRSDFGAQVRMVATEEPQLRSRVLDRAVPWHLIQRHYHRRHRTDEPSFAPHVQLEDMVWHPVERTLAAIEPSFAFWQDGAHLGLLHNHQPVSCNVLDAALNYCNRLPFEQRIVRHFQQSLWHELLLKYLRHETVERTILQELEPELATEQALV